MSTTQPNAQPPGPLLAAGPLPVTLIIRDGRRKRLQCDLHSGTAVELSAAGRLIGTAYTSYDKAGRALGIDAADLAGRLDLVALIRAARAVVLASERQRGRNAGAFSVPADAINALASPLLRFSAALQDDAQRLDSAALVAALAAEPESVKP